MRPPTVLTFKGQEKDNEIKGIGNSLDFGARIYDSRLGKFLSMDPDMEKYPFWSTYAFGTNNPIRFIDKNGRGHDDMVIIYTGALVSSLAASSDGYGDMVYNHVS